MRTTMDTAIRRDLPATKASVGAARDLVAARLRHGGLNDAIPDAILVTDELATNAIGATEPGGIIRIFLGYRPEGLVLGVWDAGDGLPEPRPVVELDEATLDSLPDDGNPRALPVFGGWGLAIVEALSLRWWTEKTTDPSGKWVCAVLNA